MTHMYYTDYTSRLCSSLIGQLRLPDSFHEIVSNIYLPLAQIIIDKKRDQPLLVSFNGAQGTGKSTLTTFLKLILESELECQVAVLSLDDFYYTRTERQRLAEQIHPLFITRGVPGTHDLDLMENVVDALMNQGNCRIPRFSKAADDRCSESDWTSYDAPVEVILFEGWCNNSPVQSQMELIQPINELEENEDANGTWRHYANEQLKQYHRRLFDHADLCVMLQAPDFERVYEWRSLQENKLKADTPNDKQAGIMSDMDIRRFIQHYERISRHTLRFLPGMADVVLPIAADHSIIEIIRNHDR